MPSWRREAETLIAETLGAPAARWVELGEALAAPGSAVPSLVLSMVGHLAPTAERARVLAEVGGVLAAEGTLVIVDHNRPRRPWAAFRALLGAPWVPGVSPASRWRRAAHATAREVQGAGFCVDRLRLAAGERIQVVVAKRLQNLAHQGTKRLPGTSITTEY